jgi:hypothetical protein
MLDFGLVTPTPALFTEAYQVALYSGIILQQAQVPLMPA